MAIKISGTTVIDDSRNLSNVGIITATTINATTITGDGSGLTGAGSTVSDNTTTNATFYPVITQTTTGTITSSNVSTTKLSFNPSTGTLSATTFSGSGASLTSIPNSATTATNANTASAIVARDANGGFSAGIVTTTSVIDTIGNVRDIPQNSQSSSYTLVAADVGKHISITTGGVTVPASVFSAGNAITIYNNSGSNQTITQAASVTLRQAGTANTGNRTLAQYGVATILCITGGATPTFVISGAGLT